MLYEMPYSFLFAICEKTFAKCFKVIIPIGQALGHIISNQACKTKKRNKSQITGSGAGYWYSGDGSEDGS